MTRGWDTAAADVIPAGSPVGRWVATLGRSAPAGHVEAGQGAWTDGLFEVVVHGSARLRVSEDTVLAYEGRVDNAPDLRRLAGAAGEDEAELLVALWRRLGPALLDPLVGELSAVVYDRRTHRLHVLRDITAARPAFVGGDEQHAVAASELPAVLRRLPSVSPDPLWVASFFVGELLEPHLSGFIGVQTVMAGHSARLDADGWTQRREAHWHSPALRSLAPRAYAERFRHLLDQAIQRRAAPVARAGVALSGGLDSSSVMASARLAAPEVAWTALSIGFTDPEGDERSYQRSVAAVSGDDISWVKLRGEGPFGVKGPHDVFERLAVPPMSANWFLFDALARVAQEQGLSVVMNGDDADSALGGEGLLHLSDLLVRGSWLRLYREMEALRTRRDVGRRQALALAGAWLRPPTLRHVEVAAPLSPDLLRELRVEERLASAWSNRLWRPGSAFGLSQRVVLRPEHLHVVHQEVDYGFRSRGLHLAMPFCDRELLEFTAGLPAAHVFANGTSKVVLRQAMAGRLPDEVRLRQAKGVLSRPNRDALTGRQRHWVEAGLAAARARPEWFDMTTVRELTTPDKTDEKPNEASRIARTGLWLEWLAHK